MSALGVEMCSISPDDRRSVKIQIYFFPITQQMKSVLADCGDQPFGSSQSARILFDSTMRFLSPQWNSVEFSLTKAGKVLVEVMNTLGERIRVLPASNENEAGKHRMSWDGRDGSGNAVTSGMYFFRLRYGAGSKLTRAMVVR
jgi:hypothetical protein